MEDVHEEAHGEFWGKSMVSKRPKTRGSGGATIISPGLGTLSHCLRGGGVSMGQSHKAKASPSFGFHTIPVN